MTELDRREKLLELTTAENGTLRVAVGRTTETAERVAVLCHGLGVDLHEAWQPALPGLFDFIVPELLNSGISTVRFDFRGHGESSGRSVDFSFSTASMDLRSVGGAVAGLFPNHRETIFVAASFGAAAVALEMKEFPGILRGIALLNPLLDAYGTFILGKTPWAKATLVDGRNPKSDVQVTIEGGFQLGRLLFDEAGSIDVSAALSGSDAPALFIHGTEDTYVSFEVTRAVHHRLRSSSLVAIPGAEHGFGQMRDRRFIGQVVGAFSRAWCSA
jgi:pimeloyl-ACP methyl ester carboxylesterase